VTARRTGYKASNLKSAMSCDYVKDYEFVAIFDADFQPNVDFLKLSATLQGTLLHRFHISTLLAG
jgi:hypothetical protein